MSDDEIEVEVDFIKHETDKAFLIEVDGEETWVPKPQILNAEDLEVGDESVTIVVPEWLADREGWA